MNYNWTGREAAALLNLGLRVDRDSDTLPQGGPGVGSLFTIAGGPVLMTGILGEVTVIIGANAMNLNLESNPTTGTTSVIDAVVAGASKEVGALFSITGTVGDAALFDDAGGVRMGPAPVVLPVGTLDFRTSANNTGEMKWSLWYVPLVEGATVTAA